jgi:hypothetical protein|uniref:Uncharacterized protein n=1 Tax=Eutreptiella gymnastica TaxID=73025 RepID=A0A7S4GHK5_9EUGL
MISYDTRSKFLKRVKIASHSKELGDWRRVLTSPRVFWGSFVFLVGSICFVVGGARGLASKNNNRWYLAGDITFLVGRLLFLYEGLVALFKHKEFRYKSVAQEPDQFDFAPNQFQATVASPAQYWVLPPIEAAAPTPAFPYPYPNFSPTVQPGTFMPYYKY